MPTSYLTPLLRHVKRRPWCYKTTKNKKEVSRKSPPCNDWLLPTETSASSIHPGELSPAVAASPAQDFRFARNVLTTSLRAIGAASCSLPIGALLSVVIEPLLLIMDQVDEMSGNAREVIRLAEQIDRLKPIVADVDFGEQSADTAMALQRELRSIKDDIAKAQVQGKLARFFNSTDDAFSLARHNANLTNLIAESTLATVREMRSSVYGIERSLSSLTPERSNSSLESSNFFLTGPEGRPGLGDITVRTSGYDIVRSPRWLTREPSDPSLGCSKSLHNGVERFIELGSITGGFGGSGGEGRIGGSGGDGEGPGLDIPTDENWKVGNISGGTGGTGGVGIDLGGTGGTGKGPVIRSMRRHLN